VAAFIQRKYRIENTISNPERKSEKMKCLDIPILNILQQVNIVAISSMQKINHGSSISKIQHNTTSCPLAIKEENTKSVTKTTTSTSTLAVHISHHQYLHAQAQQACCTDQLSCC
jgi:hypothetical protein